MTAPLFDENDDWTFDKLDLVYEAIEKIALNDLKLEVFPNQIEVIDSEKMLDAYSSVGMPVYYRHWSLGKSFLANQKSYAHGLHSLAYEIVINCNPVISYLQESNNMTMQTLVIAHAAFGHNAVFKNNTEFRRWTTPESILDELNFGKSFIANCEERYGQAEVEKVLDACHALMNHGVDTHKRKPGKKKNRDLEAKLAAANQRKTEEYDLLWEKTIYEQRRKNTGEVSAFDLSDFSIRADGVLEEPEENILYFIEKSAPNLPKWKREIIRIVRRLAQYFYPQGITKVLNEGMATWTHYQCMLRLHQAGLITDGAWLGFVSSHTNVIFQPGFNDPRYSGLNPYALGFAVFRDIQRMCEEPTAEDRQWFPRLAGSDWRETIREAMSGYNDSGFISQYLSPKVMRDMRFFALLDEEKSSHYAVKRIHNDEGYHSLRALLAEKHTRSARIPRIAVAKADILGDRSLTLQYTPRDGRPLDAESLGEVLEHAKILWGYPVYLSAPPPEAPMVSADDAGGVL